MKFGILEVRVGGLLDALQEAAGGGVVGDSRHLPGRVSDSSEQRALHEQKILLFKRQVQYKY